MKTVSSNSGGLIRGYKKNGILEKEQSNADIWQQKLEPLLIQEKNTKVILKASKQISEIESGLRVDKNAETIAKNSHLEVLEQD